MTVWLWVAVAVGALVLLWVLINLKTSRPDGALVGRVHKYRRMMFYLMPRRNDSLVLYDVYPRADKLLEYLEAAREAGFTCDITHCLVGAGFIGLRDNPKMNQFVVGRRLYARRRSSVTFSMKRERMNRTAGISAARIDDKPGETFRQLCERMDARINIERSGKKTYSDKELDMFLLLPRPLMDGAVKLAHWLDYHNLLPGAFVNNDPFYVSMYIANLGSLGMDAGYHHLYEYGTCPLFMMVGKVHDRAVVEDGQVVPRKVLHLRYTYDERIDDGLTSYYGIQTANRVIENPFENLGCVKQDGSDAWDLYAPKTERTGDDGKSTASAA